MRKILDIKQIVFDEELYPRGSFDWKTAYSYSQAMKTGAKFPPIYVGFLDGSYVLMDGKHRIEANNNLKIKSISCDIVRVKDKKELFIKAVQSNIKNGKPLSSYDRTKIIMGLDSMHVGITQISKVVQMPVTSVKKFMIERVRSSISGEEILLKTPLKHLPQSKVSNDLDYVQDKITGSSQEAIVYDLKALLENNLIDKKNRKILNDLKVIYQLIKQLIFSTRKG